VEPLVGHHLSKPIRPNERSTTPVSVLSKLRSGSTAPTLEDRAAGAAALAAYATDAFTAAADDLEAAAEQADDVVAELENEIDRIVDLQNAADRQAFTARRTAAKIRELLA
jgi:hypothetical protein